MEDNEVCWQANTGVADACGPNEDAPHRIERSLVEPQKPDQEQMKKWPQQPDKKRKQKWHLWQPGGAVGVKDLPHLSLMVS